MSDNDMFETDGEMDEEEFNGEDELDEDDLDDAPGAEPEEDGF